MTCSVCGEPGRDGIYSRCQGAGGAMIPTAPCMPTLLAGPQKPPSQPTESQRRKNTPMCTGVLDYFPDALAAVARVSKAGNEKHNPGQPLHWSREKSNDHADCVIRHMATREEIDPENGETHLANACWRALALLQLQQEARKKQ